MARRRTPADQERIRQEVRELIDSEDERRYRALRAYVLRALVPTPEFPPTYPELRDELLRVGSVRFHKLPRTESEPHVVGMDFFGETFEAAVDTLP